MPQHGGPDDQLSDSKDDLFFAAIEKFPGRLTFADGSERDVAVFGEVLVAGRADQQGLLDVGGIRRISLWTEELPELDGRLALAGPAEETKQLGIEWAFVGEMRIYYSPLGQRPPVCAESDAEYPPIELLRGRFSWNPSPPSADKVPQAALTLILDQLGDIEIGAVRAFTLERVPLTLQALVEQKFVPPAHHSLSPCTAAAPGGTVRDQRILHVSFINLSTLHSNAYVEPIAQHQLNGACEVWWQKCGLLIDSHPSIIPPTSPITDFACIDRGNPVPGFCVSSEAQEGKLKMLGGIARVPDTVEIYLVDGLNRENGGITKLCRSQDAYVILEIGKADNNIYLLAHEIGHVLGLRHPGTPDPNQECTGPNIIEGDPCSVMVPDSPNSSCNTLHNMTYYTLGVQPTGVLQTILAPGGIAAKCGVAPDSGTGAFMVRDTPYDNGKNPSPLLTPFTNRCSASDIWNARLAPKQTDPNKKYSDDSSMFTPNRSPAHDEPYVGATNYMYVRAHVCDSNIPAATQIRAHVLIANPFVSSAPLALLPAASGANPITFANLNSSGVFKLPTPGLPQVGYFTWAPSGYAPHSCVFAVLTSALEPPPAQISAILAAPGNFHFGDLATLVASSNDVAQRNLNIHKISPMRRWPTPFVLASALAWLDFSWRLDEQQPAFLTIDMSQAEPLGELLLEVNDRIIGTAKAGTRSRIEIRQQPELPATLRLRLRVPADLPEGLGLPINLALHTGNQQIAEYQHLVQIGAWEDTVQQVFGLLYGALWSTADSCALDDAMPVAERIAGIAKDQAGQPEQALDALGKLADHIAALALRLDTSADPECQIIRRRLLELAGLMVSRPNRLPSAQFAEHMRELADRVYEAAIRLKQRRSAE